MIRICVSLLVTAAMVSGATGASAACVRNGGLVCGSGLAQVSAPGNELQISRGGEYAPLSSGASLRGGDRVLVGGTGGNVSLGSSCSFTIGTGALVSIVKQGGRTCASVAEAAATPVGDPAVLAGETGFPIGYAVLGVGAAAGIGIGIALAVQKDKKFVAFVSAR